jgi:hypothetical protein
MGDLMFVDERGVCRWHGETTGGGWNAPEARCMCTVHFCFSGVAWVLAIGTRESLEKK